MHFYEIYEKLIYLAEGCVAEVMAPIIKRRTICGVLAQCVNIFAGLAMLHGALRQFLYKLIIKIANVPDELLIFFLCVFACVKSCGDNLFDGIWCCRLYFSLRDTLCVLA